MGIFNFHRHYDFLAMDYPIDIKVDGIVYPNAERAYAAIRFKDKRYKERCLVNSKKELNYMINIMTSGPLIREEFAGNPSIDLLKILRIKFNNETLKRKLLETGNEPIINVCKGQRLMGVYRGNGENLLGASLCLIRNELRYDNTEEWGVLVMDNSLNLEPSNELLELRDEIGEQLFCEFYINEILSKNNKNDVKFLLPIMYVNVLQVLESCHVNKTIFDSALETLLV